MPELVGREKATARRRRLAEREVRLARVPIDSPSSYRVPPSCDNCGRPVDDGARWCTACREGG